MNYNYYCTYCGREMNQDTVLFDMQPILTGSEANRFHILSFRMTKAELEALIASGTPQDQGYSQCQLTLKELMTYIGNKNNLNHEDIQSLELEDIKEYTKVEKAPEVPKAAANPFAGLFATEDEEETEEPVEQPTQEPTCAAIAALERVAPKNEAGEFVKEDLRSDLEVLRTLYSSGETYRFAIKRKWEKDNDGNDVLIGYTANTGRIMIVNRRICPYCGENVFEHAGTAEHRTVTFIGDQKAGKTSTILALANYAIKAATGAINDEIWGGSEEIASLATIELVSPCERLKKDLANYEEGIAPPKTPATKRLDAYSVTFRIKNNKQDRHYLLTLTDLPGELCGLREAPEKIDEVRILNEFPIALACDVFVLCFDSSTAVGGNAKTMVGHVCQWADQFQKLRESQTTSKVPGKTKGGLYAPVMLIFNKCPDLEAPEQALPIRPKTEFDSILMTFAFDEERQRLDANAVYREVGEQIGQYGGLNNAYHARLRVSPYGFAAPNKLKSAENSSLNLDDQGNIRRPKPKHVAELMKWLLEATGCIPVEAKYYPDPSSKERYCEKSGNFSEKTQYRVLPPSGKGKDGDIREALLRCHLFENPTDTDASILESYDQSAVLLVARIKAFLGIGEKKK